MRAQTLLVILFVGGMAFGLFYLMDKAGAGQLQPPAMPNTQDQSFLTGATNTINQAANTVKAGQNFWDTLFGGNK